MTVYSNLDSFPPILFNISSKILKLNIEGNGIPSRVLKLNIPSRILKFKKSLLIY